MATCQKCLEDKPQESFPLRDDRSGRYRPYCYVCKNDINRSRYEVHRREQPFKLKATRARARSKLLGTPFDLDAAYLESIWTGVCPVLGLTIYLHEKNRLDEFAAELDRFAPEKGYVKGNVHFLSRRANRLKNNATTAELQRLIDWMKKHESK